jgi:excisionase family DNA binding protein
LIPDLHEKFEAIPDDACLGPDFISNALNVSKETVRRWCRTGKLSAYTFGGRYVVVGSDFKDFLRRSKNISA